MFHEDNKSIVLNDEKALVAKEEKPKQNKQTNKQTNKNKKNTVWFSLNLPGIIIHEF